MHVYLFILNKLIYIEVSRNAQLNPGSEIRINVHEHKDGLPVEHSYSF